MRKFLVFVVLLISIFSSSYGLEGKKEVFKVIVKDPYCLINNFDNVEVLLIFGEKIAVIRTYRDVLDVMMMVGCVKYSEVYTDSKNRRGLLL